MASFQTPRKRVIGLGAAGSGTSHHWSQMVNSIALLILTPLFLLSFGPLLGQPHEAVIGALSSPYHAIVAALFLGVGLHHFRLGVQVLIEDYVQGTARELAIIAMALVSYALMGAALFAIARIAL